MAKAQITDAEGNTLSTVPTVKAAKPTGALALVELLTPEELLGPQKVLVPNSGKLVQGAPQAYILALGPNVPAEWGVKVGDRVVLQGNFVPLPEVVSKNNRPQAVVEMHCIKAVLVE